ncbi:unnamed protein product [Camellia sinensis]
MFDESGPAQIGLRRPLRNGRLRSVRLKRKSKIFPSMFNKSISISVSDEESDDLAGKIRVRRKRKKSVFRGKNELAQRLVRKLMRWWPVLLFLLPAGLLILEASRIGRKPSPVLDSGLASQKEPKLVVEKKSEANLNRSKSSPVLDSGLASQKEPKPAVEKKSEANLNRLNPTTRVIRGIRQPFNLSTITFNQGYSPLFSDFNIIRSDDDKSVSLLLNRLSGSGFISSDYYNYGLFSANIKLPSNYSAGIVVAFYMSNGDVFEKTHDELDFEFLGNIHGRPWRFQTNLYGNGSIHRGREERYTLWFDPAKEFHRYTILWTSKNIIFYVDDVPIREVVRSKAMGADYPSKPMSLYATIWDASTWATNGGKYKVNYRFQPFVSEFKDLVLQGCPVDPIQHLHAPHCDNSTAALESADFSNITAEGSKSMSRFRERYMYYSYCYDTVRYPMPPPECIIVPSEQHLFKETGKLKDALKMKFGRHPTHRRRRSRGSKRKSQVPVAQAGQAASDM